MLPDYLFSDTALLLTIGIGIVLTTVLTVRYARVRIHRSQFLIFWLIFPTACLLGYSYIRQTVDETDREQEQTTAETARIFATALSHHLSVFHRQHPDESETWQDDVRDFLRGRQWVHDGIHGIYLLRQNRDGTGVVRISPSSVSVVPWPGGDEKEGYTPIVTRAFRGESAGGRLTGPEGKPYRLFVEPLESAGSDAPTVLCMETRDWSDLILARRIWPHLFFASFLVFVATTQLIFVRRRLLAEKLRDTRVIHYEKALESLLTARDLAKWEAETKNQLLVQINGELRRPIVPIIESSSLLLQQMRKTAEDDIANIDWNHVDAILKNGVKLLEVLDDLRIFVELEWNRLKSEIAPFSPEHLLREIRNDCQIRSREQPGMTFLVDARRPMPERVLGDEPKIKRVLQRLVDWGVGHVVEGHVKLTCSVVGSQLHLEMTDSGRGSPVPQGRESTFLSHTGTEGGSTSGEIKTFHFEMHVVSRLVQFLGGTLTVSPTPGRNRRYEIAIPVEKV